VALIPSLLTGPRLFDIRYLGALHAILFLAAFTTFAVWSKSAVLAAFALFAFTDVAYAAMFNSFYMDTAAFLFLCGAMASFIWAYPTRSPWYLAAYVLFAWLLIAAKAQHGWLAIPALLPLFAVRWLHRLTLAACATLLVATGTYTLVKPPADYSAQALWNSIFARLLPLSTKPHTDLAELGLDPKFEMFIGQSAYDLGAFEQQVTWRKELMRQTGFRKVFLYYLKRPRPALTRFGLALRESANMRPPYLGNFERWTGLPPRAKSHSYAAWSGLKSWLGNRHPAIALMAVIFAGLPIALAAQRLSSGFHYAWLVVAVIIGEIGIAAFGDGIDWARHLFLGQALLDAYLCFAVAALAALWPKTRAAIALDRIFRRRQSSPNHHNAAADL